MGTPRRRTTEMRTKDRLYPATTRTYQAGWSTAARRARLAVTSDEMAAARAGHFIGTPENVSWGCGLYRPGVTAVRWITGFLDSPSRSAEGFWLDVTGSMLSPRR